MGGGDGASQYALIVADGNQVLHFHKNCDFELNYDLEFVMFFSPFGLKLFSVGTDLKDTSCDLLTEQARWNASQILCLYLTYPSAKQQIEGIFTWTCITWKEFRGTVYLSQVDESELLLQH